MAASVVGRRSTVEDAFVVVRARLRSLAASPDTGRVARVVRNRRGAAGVAWLAIVTTFATAACGPTHTPGCTSNALCAAPEVCHPGGRCGPLALDAAHRTARRVRLHPVRSALGPGAFARGESVRVEQGGAVLLGFGPLPEATRVLAAHLVLALAPESPGLTGVRTLRVGRVRPFERPAGPSAFAPSGTRGASRASGNPGRVATLPEPLPTPDVTVRVGPGPAHPLRVDLTALVADARRAGVRQLDLAVLLEGPAGSRLRLSSALHADPERRPRLDLLVP
jgi:hypothetical protein